MDILLFLAIVLVIATIYMHNQITKAMNQAQRAWADIITYEKLKSDVIPQLVQISEEYKVFESKFISEVTQMRGAISNVSPDKIDITQLQEIESRTQSVFDTFRATAENYPELASANIVRDLLAQIADKNENVAAAISIYNRSVEHFNNTVEMIPFNFVNNAISKKDKLTVFTQSGLVEDYDYKPNFS